METRLTWHTTRKGRERLERDRERVADLYPNLHFRESGGVVLLAGSVNVVQECGESDRVSLELRFPLTYPRDEPMTFETARRFVRASDNHVNGNGSFCLWTPEESPWDSSDPDALLRYLEHLIVHLDKQLVYEVTGKWPGEQRAHGDAGREAAVCEIAQCDVHAARIGRRITESGRGYLGRKAMCPCGSGATFEKCHRGEGVRVAAVLARLSRRKGSTD
jgi:hypothetical protein